MGLRPTARLVAARGPRTPRFVSSRAALGAAFFVVSPHTLPPPATILLTAAQIEVRVRELAAEIRRGYDPAAELYLVAVLKGAFVFLADLVRAMSGPLSIDFIAVSSYATGATSSGEVRLLKDLDSGLQDRHVILVEDIVDTGLTLSYLQALLRARDPRSLRTVCLLSKPARRQVAVPVEHIGFEIEDRFVVGYGLDHAGHYRNLRDIVALV